jgi:hypothetical protein
MTYRPKETVFGPPLVSRVPSLLYLLLALAVGGLVVAGENSASGTWLFDYVVVQDVHRVMSIRTFSVVLLASAVAAVIRTSMRGVRVYADGVEAREVLNFVVPKLKRYRWPQIECIIMDGKRSIAIDLWDGSRAFLPLVSNEAGLRSTLQLVAAARAIPVQGVVDDDYDDYDFEDQEDGEEAREGSR